jgi:NAD(P)H-flavin reductase
MMHFTVLELIKRGVKPESIYLSMERNMKCATGFCGHCQFGPFFVCKDGPVFRYDRIKHWLEQREL